MSDMPGKKDSPKVQVPLGAMHMNTDQTSARAWNRYWLRETKDCWIVMNLGEDTIKLPKRLTGNSRVAALGIVEALNTQGRIESCVLQIKELVDRDTEMERELDSARREAYELRKEVETLRNMRKRDYIALAQFVQNVQETQQL